VGSVRLTAHLHAGEGLIWSCRYEVKVKVKFSLERAMKAQRGSRGIAILFL
jgi:hypothetical protein